ncbi:MAG: hypothetical protein IKO40_02570 [Kiritimatiellae bacterium]|nr:hypothetical protein [Kiritimatiellia bacterium]
MKYYRTNAFLTSCLFQTSMAANFFLVIGLHRNFLLFRGIYASVLLVILNACTMIGFLECLHGFGYVKTVLSVFGGMFYVIMCLFCGSMGNFKSFKSISAFILLLLFLVIPAIADLFEMRMPKSRVIFMTVFETILGMMLVT